MSNRAQLAIIGAGCALGGFVLGALAFANPTPPANGPSSAAAIADAAARDAALASAEAASIATPSSAPTTLSTGVDWRIEESTDPLTDETIKTACVTSRNQVYLSAPYGPRSARLCVRKHPKFGQDAFVTLDGSGQILCRSYRGCQLPIRFDDGAVQNFSGGEPSDNSSETVFVVNQSRFVAAAKKSSRIRVQLEFYQNGAQTFDFPAKGLEW